MLDVKKHWSMKRTWVEFGLGAFGPASPPHVAARLPERLHNKLRSPVKPTTSSESDHSIFDTLPDSTEPDWNSASLVAVLATKAPKSAILEVNNSSTRTGGSHQPTRCVSTRFCSTGAC